MTIGDAKGGTFWVAMGQGSVIVNVKKLMIEHYDKWWSILSHTLDPWSILSHVHIPPNSEGKCKVYSKVFLLYVKKVYCMGQIGRSTWKRN